MDKEKIKDIKVRNEKLEDALFQIQNWCRAYPVKVFLKPDKTDLKKAHKVLKATGMSLDAISADAMRHVLKGIEDIINKALKR